MVQRLLSRVRAQDGFGVIELTIAVVILNVGILAIVAAFNSGVLALSRSSKVANATVIADKYLERYRGYRNCQIYLDPSSGTIPTSGTYASDSAYNATQLTTTYPADSTTLSPISPACTSPAPDAAATTAHDTSVTGPDGNSYIVDVYIVPVQVSNGGWQKQVTVVVRDPDASGSSLARETSTFDPYDAP